MNSNLVGSTSLKFNFNEGNGAVILDYLIVGNALLAIGYDGKSVILFRVSINGRIDCSGGWIHMTLDKGMINFFNFTILECTLQK